MKIKAILFAVSIFGATLFVTSNQDNNDKKNEIQKTAVDRRLIKIPSNG
ncbi:MAG: hypothetical protein WBL27_01410 [Salinimicrobium sp.]